VFDPQREWVDRKGLRLRFNGLDLNLLVALDALLTAKNLTAAAKAINLSQPAMSAAIARLRGYFSDQLFTMNGRRLVATPLAETLAAPVREALLHIQLTIAHRDAFDPAGSDRHFRIVLSDYMQIVFFPRVVERVRQVAPRVRFELRSFDDHPDQPLTRGEVDFLIFPEIYLSNGHPRAALFEESFVCIACRSNAKAARKLTFDQYMTMGHVAAHFGPTRVPAIEEWFLLKHGMKRRIEVSVPSFSMIPHFVLGSDRIATMHRRLAQHYARTMPLSITPLPMALPNFTEALQWPALHDKDPASIWLRQIIQSEAGSIDKASAAPRRRAV
jgi:LysR family transcriptional regulator, nod-box dependent transcriptional activator